MKSFAKPETVVLKQHFERKLVELEEEKKMLQVLFDSNFTFVMQVDLSHVSSIGMSDVHVKYERSNESFFSYWYLKYLCVLNDLR